MTVPIDTSPSIKARRHPLDEVCINTIRTLAIDAIQAANSGHPGTPMAMAPVGLLPVAVRAAVRPSGSDLAES